MVVRADCKHTIAQLPFQNDMIVENDLGHGEIRAEAARDHAHRTVGKSGKCGLNGRKRYLQ